jgi:hypothetical protein
MCSDILNSSSLHYFNRLYRQCGRTADVWHSFLFNLFLVLKVFWPGNFLNYISQE